MLKLQFLSGARKGEEATLNIASNEESQRPQIREDDVIKFSAILDYQAQVRLVLHEIEMHATASYEEDNKWIYEWSPGYGEYRHNCFFQNYYGLASLDLLIDAIDTNQPTENLAQPIERPSVFDNTLLVEFQEIEVLAKAENAYRVDSMIDFLARQNPELISSVFRVTRLRSGFKSDEGRSDTQYLDRIEKNIKELEKLVISLLRNPITKTAISTRIVVPTNESTADDTTIAWLSDNTSEIIQVEDIHSSFFDISGTHYSASKIQESYTSSKTDCYENQVIHGYVYTLKKALQSILSSTSKKALPVTKETPKGYASFFTQINKYSKIINKNKIDRCHKLEQRLASMLAKLRQKLPISKIAVGVPQITPKAKYNAPYREIFFRLIDFLRCGKPDWSISDELLSITSISKLFEYYCLFMLKSKIETFLAHTRMEKSTIEMSEHISKFTYEWNGMKISLLYEPRYWMAGHLNSTEDIIVNTEGWTRYQLEKYKSRRGSTEDFRQGVRGRSGVNARRSPDFVIEVEYNNEPTQAFILDAKYTRNEKAFLDYLPDLTMKYVHGIHEQFTGRTRTTGLMILNPTSDNVERTRHFHSHDYSIFGKTPVYPALLVSSLDFRTAENSDSEFHMSVLKVINNMILKINSRRLSVVA
ncbi:hypothetical protein [Pseudomonas viridiflava]|uniref:hypothetical protein n=1 Tax=Pseudomonas viridiflava TaxID=33069 RepID=UPI000F022E17|nr:hypothetical protein [Pseudomonas viridiflava]